MTTTTINYKTTIDTYISKNYNEYADFANRTISNNKLLNIKDANRKYDITNTVLEYILTKVDPFKIYCLVTGSTLNNYIFKCINYSCISKKSPYLSKELKHQKLKFESEYVSFESINFENCDLHNNIKHSFESDINNKYLIDKNDEQNNNANILNEEKIIEILNTILNDYKSYNIQWQDKIIYMEYVSDRDMTFKKLSKKYKLSLTIIYGMYDKVNKILIQELKNKGVYNILRDRKNNK